MALIAALLGACASTRGLAPHEQPLKTTASTTLIDWPQTHWWHRFADPQLNALVARATRDNPTLRTAEDRVQRARALAGIAASRTRPHVAAMADVQRVRFTERQYIPPPYAGNWYWNNAATLTLSWDLDLWGRKHQQEAAAIGATRAAAVDAREARLGVQTAVVRAWIALSRAQHLHDIASRDLQRKQALLDIARQRLQAGIGTRLAVSRIQTTLPQARGRIEALNASIATLHHQLAALSGSANPDATATLSPRLTVGAAFAIPARVPADLLGHRPDVVAARLRVEAAGHTIKAAQAAFYPDINLGAFVGVAALGFAHLFTHGAARYGGGPALSLPLFAGGRLRSGLQGADADYDMAVDHYNATVIDAMRQTADAISQLRSLGRQATQVNAAVASARNTYRIAERGYRAGLTNETDMLDAEGSLLEADKDRAQLQARRLDGYARLMQALGGGFTAPAPDTRRSPGTDAGASS